MAQTWFAGISNLAGADKQVQFNDGGVMGAAAGFEFDKTLLRLSLPGDLQVTNGIGIAVGSFYSAIGDLSLANGTVYTALGNVETEGGKFLGRQAINAAFNLNDVLLTGLAADYGLILVRESVGAKFAVLSLENQTPTLLHGDAAIWSVVKDTAGKYNVYFEAGQVKIQNKVGNGKNMEIAFFGLF